MALGKMRTSRLLGGGNRFRQMFVCHKRCCLVGGTSLVDSKKTKNSSR